MTTMELNITTSNDQLTFDSVNKTKVNTPLLTYNQTLADNITPVNGLTNLIQNNTIVETIDANLTLQINSTLPYQEHTFVSNKGEIDTTKMINEERTYRINNTIVISYNSSENIYKTTDELLNINDTLFNTINFDRHNSTGTIINITTIEPNYHSISDKESVDDITKHIAKNKSLVYTTQKSDYDISDTIKSTVDNIEHVTHEDNILNSTSTDFITDEYDVYNTSENNNFTINKKHDFNLSTTTENNYDLRETNSTQISRNSKEIISRNNSTTTYTTINEAITPIPIKSSTTSEKDTVTIQQEDINTTTQLSQNLVASKTNVKIPDQPHTLTTSTIVTVTGNSTNLQRASKSKDKTGSSSSKALMALSIPIGLLLGVPCVLFAAYTVRQRVLAMRPYRSARIRPESANSSISSYSSRSLPSNTYIDPMLLDARGLLTPRRFLSDSVYDSDTGRCSRLYSVTRANRVAPANYDHNKEDPNRRSPDLSIFSHAQTQTQQKYIV